MGSLNQTTISPQALAIFTNSWFQYELSQVRISGKCCPPSLVKVNICMDTVNYSKKQLHSIAFFRSTSHHG